MGKRKAHVRKTLTVMATRSAPRYVKALDREEKRN
jgi:hypothetical protein